MAENLDSTWVVDQPRNLVLAGTDEMEVFQLLR